MVVRAVGLVAGTGFAHSAGGAHHPDAYERYRAAIIEFVGRYWGQRLGDVHGEPAASSQLRDTITKELGWRVEVAEWMQKENVLS